MEFATFACFFIIQVGAHHLPRITGLAIYRKLEKHHWVVWIFHPMVLHTSYDYSLHLVDVTMHTFFH